MREEARQVLAAAEGPVSAFVSAAMALDAMSPAPDFEPDEFIAQARALMDPRTPDGIAARTLPCHAPSAKAIRFTPSRRPRGDDWPKHAQDEQRPGESGRGQPVGQLD